MRGSLPMTPGANNMRFSERAASVTPQGNPSSQRFYSRTAGSAAGGFRPAQASGAQSGWQRFGEPGARNGFSSAPAGAGGGWDRFGSPQQGNAPQRLQGPTQQQYGRQGGYSSPGSSNGGAYGGYGGASRSLQVAPPIVRQRQDGPSGTPGGGGFRGGNSGGRPSGGGGRGGRR